MGLDGVEIIMAVEEEFELVISDEEAGNVRTPGDLTDLVYSKLRKDRSDPCQSQHAFYVVRNVLIEELGVRRDQIKPYTNLCTLIPKDNRKEIFQGLISSISDGKTVYTELVRPGEIIFLIYSIMAIFFSIILFFTNLSLSYNILFSLMLLIVLIASTSRFKTDFPRQFYNVKGLTRIIGSTQNKIWNREELWIKIKDLIVEQLGVLPEEVVPDADFIDDLGVG